MSLVWMRNKVTAGDPLDADGVSDTLQDYASEIDGNLGEQNFDEAGFTSLSSDMETDAVLRVDHYYKAVNWTTPNGDNEPAASPTDSISIPMVLYWSSLIRRSFTTCRGGTYRIVASFQMDAGTTSNAATYWSEIAGATFAFRVDSTLYEETNQGGAERSNDPKGEAVGWDMAAYTMSISIPLDPGTHVFELVGRPARPSSSTAATWSTTSIIEVFNHEMYVVEAI